MSDPRRIECPVCHRFILVNKDGALRSHTNGRRDGLMPWSEFCYASGSMVIRSALSSSEPVL